MPSQLGLLALLPADGSILQNIVARRLLASDLVHVRAGYWARDVGVVIGESEVRVSIG